jgi:hypothetical protein
VQALRDLRVGDTAAEESSDDEWEEEAGLPPGWRVSRTGSRFLAPGGRVVGSRAQAIKLLSTMRGTEGQVEAMRAVQVHVQCTALHCKRTHQPVERH